MFYAENDLFFDHQGQIHIIKCGKRTNAVDHAFGPTARDHSWLIFVKRGNGVLKTEGRDMRFGEHSVICTFPGREFEYSFIGASDIAWICFDEVFPVLPDHLGLNTHSPIKHIEDFSAVEQAFDAIYALSRSSLQSDQYRILSHFYALFASLTERDCRARIPSSSYVDYAIHYFESNYMNELYIAELSRILGIESSYFSRLFKSKTGKSPIEYLTDLRVERARELLRLSPRSVKEVAAAVGFADPLYFSRAFKRRTGMSPSEYAGLSQGEE